MRCATLLHAAGHEQVAVDAEEVFAIEPGLPDLVEGADRLRFPATATRASFSNLTLADGPMTTVPTVAQKRTWLQRERRRTLRDWVALC